MEFKKKNIYALFQKITESLEKDTKFGKSIELFSRK